MKYCVRCGKPMGDNAKFCQACGQPAAATNVGLKQPVQNVFPAPPKMPGQYTPPAAKTNSGSVSNGMLLGCTVFSILTLLLPWLHYGFFVTDEYSVSPITAIYRIFTEFGTTFGLYVPMLLMAFICIAVLLLNGLTIASFAGCRGKICDPRMRERIYRYCVAGGLVLVAGAVLVTVIGLIDSDVYCETIDPYLWHLTGESSSVGRSIFGRNYEKYSAHSAAPYDKVHLVTVTFLSILNVAAGTAQSIGATIWKTTRQE